MKLMPKSRLTATSTLVMRGTTELIILLLATLNGDGKDIVDAHAAGDADVHAESDLDADV